MPADTDFVRSQPHIKFPRTALIAVIVDAFLGTEVGRLFGWVCFILRIRPQDEDHHLGVVGGASRSVAIDSYCRTRLTAILKVLLEQKFATHVAQDRRM